MTKIQQTILEVLRRSDGHLAAEQVFAAAKPMHPTVSLSTVYRNLNIFAESGKIRRIQRASGPDYYEKNLIPHDHAYCVRCGKVMDVKIPDLKDFLNRNYEYPILSFDLVVNSVCPECQKES